MADGGDDMARMAWHEDDTCSQRTCFLLIISRASALSPPCRLLPLLSATLLLLCNAASFPSSPYDTAFLFME